jgi:hypothetical protein
VRAQRGVVLGRDEELAGSIELAGVPAGLELALSEDEVDGAVIAGPAVRGQLPLLLYEASYRSSRPELKIIGLELISALDRCCRSSL